MGDVNYSLICAVREGRLERARELIDSFGLSYSQAWSNGYVLLCDALKNKHAAVAKLLLTRGSEVNSKSIKPSDTPLHFAAINSDIEIVKMILNKGAYVNAKNYNGNTPLHNAIKNKNIELTELLLKHGANVNAEDNNGISALQVTVELGCLQILELLLKYGVYVDSVCTSTLRKGCSPLHIAVDKGSRKIVTLLLSRGVNVDIKGEDGITPLHIVARRNRCIHIAEDLLNHGACIHSLTLKEGYTPLHFACEVGNEEAVKLFLNKGADINASTNGNLTPLLIATRRGHKTVVKVLLQYKAKVDNQDKDGKTTLHLAVEKGCSTIVEDVLKYCPDINDPSNISSLRIAVCRNGEEYEKIVVALLKYGFNVNPVNANDPELLHAAVEKGYLKIIQDLLRYGADVGMLYNLRFKGFTPLHTATINKLEEVAKLLISYEADINAQDETGKTPIFYAIKYADLKITELLLSNRAHIKDSPDLLNTAVEKECIEIVGALLQHDADINASDKYGRTALHFTALSKNEDLFGFEDNEDPDINIKGEIAELLLSKGADVESQTENGVTTLHAAIQKGYAKVVETLLKYNANVNSRVKNDSTPLHISAQRGNEKISMMLLDKGADINAKQKNGMTALHIATQKGQHEVVKVLLEWGDKVDTKIKSEVTSLHSGAQKGYQETIETVLKFGVSVDSRDKFGRTALHIASREGHLEVVVTLLEYGSDINITSKNNQTPLDHAMAGIERRLEDYYDDDDYYNSDLRVYPCELTADVLEHHLVKMKSANLYLSEKNLLLISRSGKMRDFQDKCEKEIASVKSEKIGNSYITFYDILAKSTSSLAILMRNEYIVEVLKSEDYETKFPIYASMIKSHFRKGMERKELLEQCNKIVHFLFNNFPKLPYECNEEIFSYLSYEDLRILMDACKPLIISYPTTNINDVEITSRIS